MSWSKSLEVIFLNNVLASTFHWNKQNRFGEKCKNVILIIKNGRYFAGSSAIRSILYTACTPGAHQDHPIKVCEYKISLGSL